MPNLNKVMLIGNLTRDPEIRYTPKGTAVTDIALAINRNYSLDDGTKREETTYVDITYWGRQAEVIGEYMKKGRPLYVEGRLQLDQWEDTRFSLDGSGDFGRKGFSEARGISERMIGNRPVSSYKVLVCRI